VEEKLKREFKEKLEKENASLQKKVDELERSKQEFAEKQLQADRLLEEQVQAKLQVLGKSLEAELKQKIIQEESGRLELLEKELKEQSEKVRELNRTKAEIEKLKREKDELQEAVEAQAEQLRHESQRSQEIVELLRLEMAALRKDFSLSRQMMPWQDGLRLSPAIQQLSLAMSEVGVPAGLRALLRGPGRHVI
jgi:hypothetical protein